MPKSAAILLSLVVGLFSLATAAHGQETRLYISQFQSGSLAEVDPATGSIVGTLPVKDDAGIAGMAVGPNGGLFVLDGGSASRLRLVDAASLHVVKQVDFPDRVLRFNDQGLIYASANGRWLLIPTYQYKGAVNRIRIFDIGNDSFTQATLPDTGCVQPALASAIGGTLFALCPGQIIGFQLNGHADPTTKFRSELPFTQILAATAAADGQDVFIVGSTAKGAWHVARWQQSDGVIASWDDAAILDMSDQALAADHQTWCGLSHDEQRLILVRATHILIFDRNLIQLSRYELPSAARAVALDPTADAILTLHAAKDGHDMQLARTSLAAGTSTVIATPLAFANAPVALHAAEVGGNR